MRSKSTKAFAVGERANEISDACLKRFESFLSKIASCSVQAKMIYEMLFSCLLFFCFHPYFVFDPWSYCSACVQSVDDCVTDFCTLLRDFLPGFLIEIASRIWKSFLACEWEGGQEGWKETTWNGKNWKFRVKGVNDFGWHFLLSGLFPSDINN